MEESKDVTLIGEEILAGGDIGSYDFELLKKLAVSIAYDNTKAILFDKLITHISKEQKISKMALKREVVASAEKVQRKQLSEDIGDYVMPDSYYVDKGLLHKTTKDGFQIICEYCIVTEVYRTTDKKESIMSLFFPKRQKNVQIETEEFVESKKLEAKLINNDIFVGRHLNSFKDYISSFINVNENSIKKVVLASSTGWQFIDVIKYEDGDFVRVNKLRYCNPILESCVEYVDGIQSKIYKEGDIKVGLEILNVGLKYRGSALSILSSLASTLIYPLRKKGLGNFITNFAGTTGKGKTLSARVGLSLFGDASEGENSLAGNMNSTQVGLEIKFNQQKDMPVLLDEAGTTKGSAEVKARAVLDTIFQFFSGQGRSRATKTLKQKDESSFRGVLLMTMEYDLQTIEKMAGTQEKGYFRRTIEVFTEHEDFLPAKEVFDFGLINSNFGLIAEPFILTIVNNFSAIEEDFVRYEKELSKPELRGKEKYFAVLFVVLEHLKRINLITEKSYSESKKHLYAVYAENLEIMEEITTGAHNKWVQQLMEYISMHSSQFEDGGSEVRGIKLGSIHRMSQGNTKPEIRLYPKALDDFLIENGINNRAFCKKMVEMGILKTEAVKDGSIRFQIKRDKQRMYVFDLDILEKYDDEEIQDSDQSDQNVAVPPIKKQADIINIQGQFFNLDEDLVDKKLTESLNQSKNRNVFVSILQNHTSKFSIMCNKDGVPVEIVRLPF